MSFRQVLSLGALMGLTLFLVACGSGPLVAVEPIQPSTPTRTPKPTFTPLQPSATPEASATLVTTVTEEPTESPTPPSVEETPSPSAEATGEPTAIQGEPTATAAQVLPTATPLAEATATSLPTSTPLPPTATPRPTESPTPAPSATPAQPYRGTLVRWEPNCAGTQVKGRVTTATGQPLGGVTVQVLLFNQQFGDPPRTNGEGRYEFNRFGTADPLAPIQYTVTIIDPATGAALSNAVTVTTNSNECGPGGSGQQIATIDFVQN